MKKKNLITQSIKAKIKYRVTGLTVQLHALLFLHEPYQQPYQPYQSFAEQLIE